MKGKCVVAVIVLLVLLLAWVFRRRLAPILIGGALGAAGVLVFQAGRRRGAQSATGGGANEARPSGHLQPMIELPVSVAVLDYTPYSSKERKRTTLHLGQRKLLLSEVDFLSDFASPGDTVVYAGAAPGIHIGLLAQLFPRLRFELYDPREFTVKKSKAIKTTVGFFTDETARKYAGRDDVLFVSDIRVGTEGRHPNEAEVAKDMEMQMDWVRIMNPRAAMLKFRPAYDSEKPVRYLAGVRRLQAWAPQTSTETRLVATRPYTTTEYSPKDHEGRMFHLNSVVRESAQFDHGVPLGLVEGLDHRFDSATEVRIWAKYLRSAGAEASSEGIARLFHRASKALGRGIIRGTARARPKGSN
jgi:cap2 methyltransferase